MTYLKEFTVKIYSVEFTVVAFDIADVARCYPNAAIVAVGDTLDFFGQGTGVSESYTKATPVASSFSATVNSTTEESDATADVAEITAASPVAIAFKGLEEALAWRWVITGKDDLYDRSVSVRFETAGTYAVELHTASDGGEGAIHYMTVTIT